MAPRYTCFVISPIGDEGSPTREEADEVFTYIIADALPDGFVVERADHIPGIADTITNEMVTRIQNSDLCIIDLSGLNPNVMYECGRRHERGRPSILIGQQDPHELPFDVGAYQYIQYPFPLDGAAVKEVYDVRDKIRKHVSHFMDIGFDRVGGKSIEDVSRQLAAMDGKLEVLLRGAARPIRSGGTQHSDVDDLLRELGGVVPAVNYALQRRDPDLMDELLPRVPNRQTANFIRGGLVQGTAIGSRVAFDMLVELVQSGLDEFPLDLQVTIISGYSLGANRFDEEEQALQRVHDFAEELDRRIDAGEDVPAEHLAMTYNAWQRLLHGLGKYDEALRVGERALELAPDEQAFLYNQALNAKGADRLDLELEFVDRYVSLMRKEGFTEPDDDHLAQAIRTYHKCDRDTDALEMWHLLQEHYPIRAQMMAYDDDLRDLFTESSES